MKRFFHSPIFLFVFFCFCGCAKQDGTQAANVTKLSKAGKEARIRAEQFYAAGKSDSAFANYLKSKEAYSLANKKVYAAYALLQMGEILNAYNDYDELQATAVEALKYLNIKKDSSYVLTVYTDLGISFSMSHDLPSAEANYMKGKEYAVKPWEKATLNNNIAYANILAGNYQKAFTVLSEVKAKYDLADSLPIKAKILDNYGYAAFKLGKTVDGNPMQEALKIRLENKDISGTIASYIHLAETELAKDPKESLKKALLAEQIAYKNNSASDRLQAMDFIVKHSNPAVSKRYAIAYIHLSDSLQMAQQKARKAFALIKYNYRLARQQTALQESERQKERFARIAWTCGTLFLLVVILWLIAHFIKRTKRVKEESSRKATYDTEVRISTKLHDELANQVHKTIVFAETQKLDEPENKEVLLSRLDLIYEGTRKISRDNSDVPENADFGKLIQDLLAEYSSKDCKVIAKDIPKVDWKSLAYFKRIAFFRILQEMLANMRKHSKCSYAVFSFSETEQRLIFEYKDNGIGYNARNAKRKHGLGIMENRISDLKGTYKFDTTPGNGFGARIEFPI